MARGAEWLKGAEWLEGARQGVRSNLKRPKREKAVAEPHLGFLHGFR
jgi:hypothetical protein